MGRSPCCSKVGLRRGPWSTKEDTLLTEFIQQNGEGQWRSLPKKAGLLRCGKSCRLRWMNYLRPGIVRGNITEDEEDLIVRLHGLLGNRWSLIAGRLPGRTDNEIKNYWNTHLLKKLKNSGMDIPKPAKIKKSGDGEVKKRRKQRKGADGAAAAAAVNEEEGVEMSGTPKTKVYLPKPIRVSSEFSRTSSYDSLVSDASDKAAEVVVSCFPVVWPPLFELEDANYGGGEEEEEDFLHGGYITPLLTHADSDVHMLDKVYDEYLQLL